MDKDMKSISSKEEQSRPEPGTVREGREGEHSVCMKLSKNGATD